MTEKELLELALQENQVAFESTKCIIDLTRRIQTIENLLEVGAMAKVKDLLRKEAEHGREE